MNSFSHKGNRKLTIAELERKSLEEFKDAKKLPLVLVLDSVRSLHNVGSVFRNADAFAVEKIYLCGISATPPHREINKTALGATESVAWEYVEDTRTVIKKLKERNFDVYALEQTAESTYLSDFNVKANKIALIFGHEVKGVQQAVIDLCDGAIEIPQLGTKHSFNVSVSAGIAMWELYKKMKL